MMNPTVTIQEARVDTFEATSALLEQFFQEMGFGTPAEKMRASLRPMITDPCSSVFLALRGEVAVGVATVTTSIGLEYGRSAELEDLYVLPVERGCGVASSLIDAVCVWAGKMEASVVLVTVTPEAEAEHALSDFYGRRGFANTGRVILERGL